MEGNDSVVFSAGEATDELAHRLLNGEPIQQISSTLGESVMNVQAATKRLFASRAFSTAMSLVARLQAREWLLRTYCELSKPLYDDDTIDEMQGTISRDRFLNDYYFKNRPLLWRQMAKEWPAVKSWNREYLSRLSGESSVEVMFGRESVAVPFQNVAPELRRSMRFADFLDLVYTNGPTNDYYLVSRNEFFAKPNTGVLLRDLRDPSIAQMDSKGNSVRLWFGPGGTVTPLHYDGLNQLFVQIIGRKRVRLIAPYYSAAMQQVIPGYAGIDPSLDTDGSTPCISVELSPGDGLFIPVAWWHAVEAYEVSASITFRDFGVRNEYP